MTVSIYGTSGFKLSKSTEVLNHDSGTLDCYEEGTWTGSLRMTSSGTPTSGDAWDTSMNSTGIYIKVGQVCYVSIFFDVTGYNAYSALKIDGLPFAAGGPSPESALSLGHCRGIRFNYNGTILNTVAINAFVIRGRNTVSLSTSSKSSAFTGFWYISNQSGQGKYIHIGGTYNTLF